MWFVQTQLILVGLILLVIVRLDVQIMDIVQMEHANVILDIVELDVKNQQTHKNYC